jgi:hypothetical protein
MKAKVAVTTVQGKAYFLIVNALKEQNIPFVSLIPGAPIPSEVKLVITTEKEKPQVNSGKVLIFNSESELDSLMSAVTIRLQGKESYERMVIGIDPGEVIGLAVIADGKVVDKANCLGIQEAVNKIKSILKNVNLSATAVKIKIGNGVPAYHELIEALDKTLSPMVVLEVVSEAGTNLPLSKRSRGLRHITSATRIAARVGYIYLREKKIEANN